MHESPPQKRLSVRCSLPFMRPAGQPHGASRLVLAMSAWPVKTRRAFSRHCRYSTVNGQMTSNQQMNTPPPPRPPNSFDAVIHMQENPPHKRFSVRCSSTLYATRRTTSWRFSVRCISTFYTTRRTTSGRLVLGAWC